MAAPFVFDIISQVYPDSPLRSLLLTHSVAVARKALEIIDKKNLYNLLDCEFVENAAMLHDIGIIKTHAPSIHCEGNLPYLCHGIAGREILDGLGLPEKYGLVCERHTGSGISKQDIIKNNLPLPRRDFLPVSLEEKLICYADKFFSKSTDPTLEKDINTVRNSMMKFGEPALMRFDELYELFGC